MPLHQTALKHSRNDHAMLTRRSRFDHERLRSIDEAEGRRAGGSGAGASNGLRAGESAVRHRDYGLPRRKLRASNNAGRWLLSPETSINA